jgi:hypothetical protein
MEPASCHPSGIGNFEVSPRLFFENLCTPALRLTKTQAATAEVSLVTSCGDDDREQIRGMCAEINIWKFIAADL